jgi:cytochrome c551/c552
MSKILAAIAACVALSAHAQYRFEQLAPASNDQVAWAQQIRSSGSIQNLVTMFNRIIVIPKEVPIVVRSCGAANAYYRPSGPEIVLCYELFLQTEASLQRAALYGMTRDQLAKAIHAEMAFVLLHEIGHHLIDEFQLPVLGREEDAADQIASFVLLTTGGDQILARSLSFFANRRADAFEIFLRGSEQYGAQHGLPEQRLANQVCWGLGKNPQLFAQAAITVKLPQSRVARCRGEFERMDRDIRSLLGDRFRPTALARSSAPSLKQAPSPEGLSHPGFTSVPAPTSPGVGLSHPGFRSPPSRAPARRGAPAPAPEMPDNTEATSDPTRTGQFSLPASMRGNWALATKHQCMNCHAEVTSSVGPSFKAIAERYRGRDVSEALSWRVIQGSVGEWGTTPAPRSEAPADDVLPLVRWILSM